MLTFEIDSQECEKPYTGSWGYKTVDATKPKSEYLSMTQIELVVNTLRDEQNSLR